MMMIAPDEGGMIQKQKHVTGLHESESIWSKNKTRTGDSQASSSFTTMFPTLKQMQDFHVMWGSIK